MAGRLDWALRNFLETFAVFAAVVLVAHTTDTHDALTEWGRDSTSGDASSMYPSTRLGPPDPFAGVERAHDRHLVVRRRPAAWMTSCVPWVREEALPHPNSNFLETPSRRSSENSPSRNCLINSRRASRTFVSVAKNGDWGYVWPL